MISPPKTLEEARKMRYGRWNVIYKLPRCAFSVKYLGKDVLGYGYTTYRQCSRKLGHGPEKLYCKQHGRMVEK